MGDLDERAPLRIYTVAVSGLTTASRQRVPGLVRMSVRLESVEHLVAHLDQALRAAKS